MGSLSDKTGIYIMTTELDGLIQYWKDYRAEKGATLGIEKWERVNDTIIELEEKKLREAGVESLEDILDN